MNCAPTKDGGGDFSWDEECSPGTRDQKWITAQMRPGVLPLFM